MRDGRDELSALNVGVVGPRREGGREGREGGRGGREGGKRLAAETSFRPSMWDLGGREGWREGEVNGGYDCKSECHFKDKSPSLPPSLPPSPPHLFVRNTVMNARIEPRIV